MKQSILGRNKKFDFLLLALLLIECFLPAIAAYLSNTVVFLYFLYKNKGKLIKPFYSMKYIYVIVALGLLIGFISLIIGRFESRDYLRDIYYFTNPILVILNGANIKRRLDNDTWFFNSIIIAAGIQATYYFAHAGMIILDQGFNLSLRSWRTSFGDSSVIAAAAVVLILINSGQQFISLSRLIRTIILSLSIAEIVFSFSRTNILLVIITIGCVAIQQGVFMKARKWFRYIGLGLVVLLFSLLLLGKTEAMTMFAEKSLDSFTEINSRLDWSDASVIERNWRGYETHSAIKQFNEYPFYRQVYGYGFGERVEVGIYAYLFLNITNADGSERTSIPVLHNGYATMLCKLGIIGVFLYLMFYFSLIKYARKHRGNNTSVAHLLVAVVVAIAVETYFLNGLFREHLNYPYIYMIGYLGYTLKFKESAHVFKRNY